MKALLQYVTSMTRQRDHALLDASVIAALKNVTAASRVRKLEALQVGDEMRLKISACNLHACDECNNVRCGGESLALGLELADAVTQHQTSAQKIMPDGTRILWLPVWLEDNFVACLELWNPAECDEKTLEMALAITTIYANQRSLLDYSQRDSLTDLLNRKTFDQNFSKVLSALARSDTPSGSQQEERRHTDANKNQWLAVVDIDHFKRVNDEFGHLYGDEVLLLLSNLIRSSFRPHDGLFRFGGEEFVILLQAAELKDAQRIFERFRSNVEKCHFPQVGQVTVSIGFTRIGLNATPVVVLGHADMALYHAKTHGRNQVCYYEKLVADGQLKSDTSSDVMEFF